MELRPHHLLCTQAYSGKGYNTEFIENVNHLVQILRNDKEASVNLVFSTDDMCIKCPRKKGIKKCKDDYKVKVLDKKVIEYFNLEEKEYNYHQITKEINSKITVDILDDICSTCEWYSISACKRIICGEE